VAVAGVALSILVMLLSVAIVNGFKANIRGKILGFNSHIVLRPVYDSDNPASTFIPHVSELAPVLDRASFITHWQPLTSLPAILKTDSQFKGMYLKGIDGRYDLSFLRDNLVSGQLPDFSSPAAGDKVLISAKVSDMLNLKAGDRINIYFVDPGIRVRPVTVAAIFDTHFQDYDQMYMFGSIRMVNELCGLSEDDARSIEIITPEYTRVPEYMPQLQRTLSYFVEGSEDFPALEIDNVQHLGETYFNWLDLLDTNVIVILTLMTLVSCFTLVSCMLILILERVKTIGVLKALGVKNMRVRGIFIYLALRIAVVGMLIGNTLAIAFIFVQQRWHMVPLDAESYYIDYVPVQFSLTWMIAVNVGALLLIWFSLILPSHIIAGIQPSRTIKTE